MAIETLPDTLEETKEKVENAFEKNWNVIVWNDPINLMNYVVFVFMKVLAFPKEKATKHMLEVHHDGKSCVATETREKAEQQARTDADRENRDDEVERVQLRLIGIGERGAHCIARGRLLALL